MAAGEAGGATWAVEAALGAGVGVGAGPAVT